MAPYAPRWILRVDQVTFAVCTIILSILAAFWFSKMYCQSLRKPRKPTLAMNVRSGSEIPTNCKKGAPLQTPDGHSSATVHGSEPEPVVVTLPHSTPSDQTSSTTISKMDEMCETAPKEDSLPTTRTPKHSLDGESFDDDCIEHSIHPAVKGLVSCTVVFALLFAITIFAVVNAFLYNFVHNGRILCIAATTGFSWLYLQRCALYLYYLFRVYLVFKGSVFSMSWRKTQCLLAAICLFNLFCLSFYVVVSSVLHNCEPEIIPIALVPSAFMEFGCSFFCIWLFLNRLHKLSHQVLGDKFYTKEHEDETPKPASRRKAMPEIQYLMRKLTVLAFWTIGSTFVSAVGYLFVGAWGVLAIDTPLNVWCLLLSFGFCDHWYKACCCCFIRSKTDVANETVGEAQTECQV